MKFIIPKDPLLSVADLYPRWGKKDVLPLRFKGNNSHWFFWARSAIYHGVRSLQISPSEHILVPSYHCSALIEPILRCGIDVVFYNIRRDCSADIDDILKKINNKTRAIVIVHYFGFPQPISEIMRLCEKHHLYLIEDCAHVLIGRSGGRALGTFGDISIFSLRKMLPLYDGGQLVINNPNIRVKIPWDRSDKLYELKVLKNSLENMIDNSQNKIQKIISSFSFFSNYFVKFFLHSNRNKAKVFEINNYDIDFIMNMANLKMSGFSQYIMGNLEIEKLVVKRRKNYYNFVEGLRGLPQIVPFYPCLPQEVCPWVLPVIFTGKQNFHIVLRERGIPAFTWSDVIHPKLSVEDFPDSAFLYHNLVLLPVHQSLTESEIKTMIQIIAQALNSWTSIL